MEDTDMKCPKCQFDNPDGIKFCGECGAKLERLCPDCGHSNPPVGFKFCGECGQPRKAPRNPHLDAPPAPQPYTPKHLAEKILTSKGALEGERKQVTVLFADLKGSMELLADRDPEEARKLLDPVLERMMEAVHHYEGTVNQVMGDGIMALFGAPLAHEDHAVRACYAALRMQESVKRYAEEVRRTEGVPVQIRVGLNSGEVVVRVHRQRPAHGLHGRGPDHASGRPHGAAGGAGVDPPDRRHAALAEGYVQVKALGPRARQGAGDPVEVYELTGAGHGALAAARPPRRGG